MTSVIPARLISHGRHARDEAATTTPLGPVAALTSLAGLALILIGCTQAKTTDVNGYGLISALPPMALAGLATVIAVLVLSLFSRRVEPRWLLIQLVVLVVALDVGPALIEPLPRFATAWTHAGFSEYISRSGQVLHHTDARFSWPAFFAAAGYFCEAVGIQPLELVRWTPLALGLLYLIPLSVIVRTFVEGPRRQVLALLLFIVGNWVGQDYFAPQGANFLLFLVLMAVLVRYLSHGSRTTRFGGFIAHLLRRDDEHETVSPRAPRYAEQVVWLLVVITLYLATAVSHQLTQFFAVFAVTALVAVGACRLRWLPVIFAVITLSFFVWGAQDYWSGHLHDITSNLGSFGTSLHENVTARATGASDPARDAVVRVRLALTAAMLGLAVLGLVRDRRRSLLVPAVLAAAPIFVIGLQSYGGEAALRVYFFSLPWLSILGAYAFRVDGPRAESRARQWIGVATAVAVGIGAVAAFLLARYGNEVFEQMHPRDRAAVKELYRIAPAGSSLFILSESVPWRDQELERFEYGAVSPPPLTRDDLPKLLDAMRSATGPSYLLLTEGQWVEIHYLGGQSTEKVEAGKQMYETSPELRRIYGEGDIGIYVLSQPPAGKEPVTP